MENLVDKIIEIDKSAEQRLEQAELEKKQVMIKIDKQKQKIVQEISENGNQKLKEFEKSQQAEAEEQIKNIKKQQQISAEHLQQIFNKKHDVWVADLVDRTLKQ